jgi:hypothetical protein
MNSFNKFSTLAWIQTFKKTTLLVFTVLLSLPSFLIIAQPVNNLVKDVTMAAPNAAALGKYGDYRNTKTPKHQNTKTPKHQNTLLFH